MQNKINPNNNTPAFFLNMSFIKENGIVSYSFTAKDLPENPPSYSDVFLYLLVQTGTGQISITGKSYTLKPSTLVVLAPEYHSQLSALSHDFQYEILLVTKSYLDTLPASDKMYKHIAKVMLQQRQVNLLSKQQFLVLSETMHTIQSKLSLTGHHLKQEIIQNTLVTFLLEISNIWIENHWDSLNESHQIRYEYILKSFFDSLLQNYCQEHLVPFYAEQLNITPQYLSLIVKALTGRTPSQFIFERLYCEARVLLDHPDLSIKEISEQLHFSDQSAFGKFFKKRSGISPVDYRKKRRIL